MLPASLIQKLKQSNISANGEKTVERLKKVWKSASSAQKKAIEELAGVGQRTIYRVYNTGSISAKIAVSVSQTLNVDPYYLTGESDEMSGSSDQTLNDFLIKLGYKDLLAEYGSEIVVKKTRRKRQLKQATLSQSDDLDGKISGEGQTPDSQVSDKIASFDEPSVVEIGIKEVGTLGQEQATSARESESEPLPEMLPIEESAPVLFFDEFTDDEIQLLLQALKIRAKAGVASAVELSGELRNILLS